MSEAPAAINCTSCGGSLPLHGGHRVRALACGYCGSVMDAHAGYQVVEQFRNLRRPRAPLKIGLVLTLKGVSHTVIGIVDYVMLGEGEAYSWVSYQLYSPTHGYSWLTFEDGHVVFSYRVRELPRPLDFSGQVAKTQVEALGRTFLKYEAYTARIRYVEGELTWIAKVGDEVWEAEAIDPPYVFGLERSVGEIEYGFGEYLDRAAVQAAVGPAVTIPTPDTPLHAAQPYLPSPLIRAAFRAGIVFAPVALLALLVTFAAGRGSVVQQAVVEDPVAGGVVPFIAASASGLYQVSLETNLSNTWAYYEVDLLRDGDEVELGSLGQDVEYYFGYDEGNWTEGSRTATATFHVPEQGDYELEVRLIESESPAANGPVTVEVREGVYVVRYFALLAIVTVIGALILPVRRWMFEAKRWSEVTGHKDDDD